MATPFLLDSGEAAQMLGISRRGFYELVKRPGFPAARSLGPRASRWLTAELQAWAAALPPAQSDEPRQLAAARAAKAAGQPTSPWGGL